jgi:hypothetical protein
VRYLEFVVTMEWPNTATPEVIIRDIQCALEKTSAEVGNGKTTARLWDADNSRVIGGFNLHGRTHD